jgi:hypothetical protein
MQKEAWPTNCLAQRSESWLSVASELELAYQTVGHRITMVKSNHHETTSPETPLQKRPHQYLLKEHRQAQKTPAQPRRATQIELVPDVLEPVGLI